MISSLLLSASSQSRTYEYPLVRPRRPQGVDGNIHTNGLDYQADIWSNIRFQISDARCRCHNLSVDPDFRFQISDFWAKIYPRTRFLVRFQISDFTCPDQAPSHGPPTSFAGWRITRQSAICNLLEHNAKRKQPGRFRSQFASSRCPWAVLLTSAPSHDLRRPRLALSSRL